MKLMRSIKNGVHWLFGIFGWQDNFIWVTCLYAVMMFVLSGGQELNAANKNKQNPLVQAFELVATLDNFTTLTDAEAKELFSEKLGDIKCTVYGNAEPREQVLSILDKIPHKYLYRDYRDENDRITRFYIKKIKGKSFMLFTVVGINGNDLMVALFSGASLAFYKEVANERKE